MGLFRNSILTHSGKDMQSCAPPPRALDVDSAQELGRESELRSGEGLCLVGTPQLFFGFVYTLYKYQVRVEEHATTDGRTLSGDYLSYLDCSAMVHFKKEAS